MSGSSVKDTQPPRRVRDLGIAPGILPTGPANAMTDVAGVRVGHTTRIEGNSIRTGVTAVLPHDGNLFQEKLLAGCAVGNGFGKSAGLIQIQELGMIESPIILTNTLAVGTAINAIITWTLEQPGNESVRSVNAVVGECNDGLLNDIRNRAVTEEDCLHAIRSAGPIVAEGCLGAGTGVIAFGFKAGIGSSSRALPESLGGWTLGALVQANFGGVLMIDGHRIGEALGRHSFREALADDGHAGAPARDAGDGSCMIILATDAPLSPRQLNRLARRGLLGLARTGSFMSNGSGDIAIAFSTAQRIVNANDSRTMRVDDVPNDRISPLFLAAVEAVEESVYNALTMAQPMTGYRGARFEAIDREFLQRCAQSRARS